MASVDKITNGISPPLTIGVFGGSFNPIHLGHALLAVTTQQTKDYVDQVVLVPVYKHAVKRDLLPFDDRLRMCELAVKAFDSITVSDVEKEVGASNGAMLRGLKNRYPPGTRLIWICGDDFFHWMHTPKGLETLAEVEGLIVQRRLHRHEQEGDRFYKDPIDENRVRQVALKMNLEIDYIYGELPHFSSTLVRRAPGHWRSFLTNTVAQYLDERSHLLQKLVENLQAEAEKEADSSDVNDEGITKEDNEPPLKRHKRTPSLVEGHSVSASVVMLGLEAVHSLQKERGYTALSLSVGKGGNLAQAQANTDRIVQEILQAKVASGNSVLEDFVEAKSLAIELERIPQWLELDRKVLRKYALAHVPIDQNTPEGWLERVDIAEKFNPRIDVLIGATVRALTEILQIAHKTRQEGKVEGTTCFNRDVPELFRRWLEGKEALGRERAFICAGGPLVPGMVKASLKLRERSMQTIDTKERMMSRVLALQAGLGRQHAATMAAPEALHNLLDQLSRLEYSVIGCFGFSTSLPKIHRLLTDRVEATTFDVLEFFSASTAAIDFLLSFAKALAASALAGA